MKLETSESNPENLRVHWKKVALIGVGLLGGSLGMALRQVASPPQVAGYVRRKSSMRECIQAGAVDVATQELQEAVGGADLVVMCTPIARMHELAKAMLPYVGPGCVVTDVGSAKGTLVDHLEPLFRRIGAHYVGSHPMAGSEKTGVTAARADLFKDAVCVVTPTARSHRLSVSRLTKLWKSVGARVLVASPAQHDEWVSRTSHLPHVAATALANLVLQPSASRKQRALCATGFRDTTRIASGSPEMWRDIALANRVNLRRSLGEFMAELRTLERLLAKGDEKGLTRFFETAKRRRDQWVSGSITSSPE